MPDANVIGNASSQDDEIIVGKDDLMIRVVSALSSCDYLVLKWAWTAPRCKRHSSFI